MRQLVEIKDEVSYGDLNDLSIACLENEAVQVSPVPVSSSSLTRAAENSRLCWIEPRDRRILSTIGERSPDNIICEGEIHGFETT
jgi:hypothetical protein